jgi:hypothetical protein
MGLFFRRNGSQDGDEGNGSPRDAVSVRAGGSPRQRVGRDEAGVAVMDPPTTGRNERGREASMATSDGRSIVLTYDGWRVGELQHFGERVLDALSSPVLYLRSDGRTWEIDRDEVIMVVPPPLTQVSRLKIAKQPIDVAVDIGVAKVRGQIHVLAGVGPWETWQRSTSGFVAITDVSLDFPDGTTETADVVLVSRHAAHAGLSEAPPVRPLPGAWQRPN